MKTPDISQELVGGILVSDAAGHYPGLELLNYIYGCSDGILSDDPSPEFERAGQDFARRLVWDSKAFGDERIGEDAFVGTEAQAVLGHLLRCLQLPVADRGSTNWEAAHFFPYTRALVHWDARKSRSAARTEAQIERRYLRGGGAFAHKILREDPDADRKESIRLGFEALMPQGQSTPLDRLASVLRNKGAKTSHIRCEIEEQAVSRQDEQDNHFRTGIERILSHSDLSSTARVKAIMNWTGFWLAICQSERSAARLGNPRTGIIIDCGSGPSQLRRESARAVKEIISSIGDAAADCLPAEEELKTKARRDMAGFFTRSCAWIGMLNAFTGRRHFVVGLDLLEALVLAQVSFGEEISYETFIDRLENSFGLIIGRNSARTEGLLARLDASIFEDNEEAFARQLGAAGLMHAYSDTTRMVGTKALK
jgi:hypothetical protein